MRRRRQDLVPSIYRVLSCRLLARLNRTHCYQPLKPSRRLGYMGNFWDTTLGSSEMLKDGDTTGS